MRHLMFFLWILTVIAPGYGEKIAEFPQVMKPKKILLDGNRLVIGLDQEYTVQVYSNPGFELQARFGKRGEGPGEVRRTPLVFARTDSYLLFSRGKLLWFSKEGELQKEMKISREYLYVKPVAKYYVAARDFFDPEDFSHTMKFYLLDSKTSIVKEIYQGDRDVNTARGMVFEEFRMVTHFLGVETHGDRIFIGDSRKGFHIDVLNARGDHLYAIHPDVKRVRVSKDFRQKITDEFRSHESELWPLIRNVMTFYEYFPAIRNFTIADGRIYVTTHHSQDDRQELITLDLKGNILNRRLIPFQSWRIRKFYGNPVDLFAIRDGKLYELVDNDQTEVFELHVTGLEEF